VGFMVEYTVNVLKALASIIFMCNPRVILLPEITEVSYLAYKVPSIHCKVSRNRSASQTDCLILIFIVFHVQAPLTSGRAAAF
jgi:hypothetical protein